VVGDGLAAPQPAQELQPLVEPVAADACVVLLAEAGQLAAGVHPQSHAEHEPAAAQVVEADRLAGELLRPPPGDRRDQRPDAQRLGGGRHGREHDPRIRHRPERRRAVHVIPDEEPVESGPLGVRRQAGDDARIGELPEGREREAVAHQPRLVAGDGSGTPGPGGDGAAPPVRGAAPGGERQ